MSLTTVVQCRDIANKVTGDHVYHSLVCRARTQGLSRKTTKWRKQRSRWTCYLNVLLLTVKTSYIHIFFSYNLYFFGTTYMYNKIKKIGLIHGWLELTRDLWLTWAHKLGQCVTPPFTLPTPCITVPKFPTSQSEALSTSLISCVIKSLPWYRYGITLTWQNFGAINIQLYLFGTLQHYIRLVWSHHGYFGYSSTF